MTMTSTAIRAVSVVTTGEAEADHQLRILLVVREGGAEHGEAEAQHEHIYGTRKPDLWWIFFGRRRVRLPVNVYVIEHESGLVLFDAGQTRALVTDPNYYPDRVTALFMRNMLIRPTPEQLQPGGSGHQTGTGA